MWGGHSCPTKHGLSTGLSDKSVRPTRECDHLIPCSNARLSTISRPGTKRVSAANEFSMQKHCGLRAAVLK